MQSINFNDVFYIDESSPSGIRWKIRPANCKRIGDMAGTKTKAGYWRVEVRGKNIMCHRIIWEMVNGTIPDGMNIDHIDGNSLNNCISNLRLATDGQNSRNYKKPITNTSGEKNVYWRSEVGKWYVVVGFNNKHISIGYYANFEDAVFAARKARSEIHKEFARH